MIFFGANPRFLSPLRIAAVMQAGPAVWKARFVAAGRNSFFTEFHVDTMRKRQAFVLSNSLLKASFSPLGGV